MSNKLLVPSASDLRNLLTLENRKNLGNVDKG